MVLEGKSALVTGGSSGIGKASARLLAQDGAAVMIMGRREDKLLEARDQLLSQVPGGRIEIAVGDAADEASAKAAVDKAHAMAGRLDIIVSAVGMGSYKPILLAQEADLLAEYRATVLTAHFMIHHGVPRMENGGSIVCVSSTAGAMPCAGLGAYAAAKAALEMFVKVAAMEMGKAQIRVNAVRPGLTRGEGTEGMFADTALVQSFTDIIALNRVGESIDLARAIRFLAGPESGWVTGQIFAADGGQELRGFPDPDPLLEQIYGQDVMSQIRAGKRPG